MNTTLRITFALTLGLLALMGTLALIELPSAQASPNGSIRYVATSGNDLSSDCTNMSTPCRTVQHAVDVASSGDEIRVATGVYTDVSVRPRKDIVATGVVTQIVYISKTVTIRGGFATADWTAPYPLTQPTTLDAQGRGRVLYLTGYHTATLEGLRLTGGNAAGLGGDTLADAGGGVYIWAAKAAISNCQVFSSTAGRGGGLYLSSSPSTLSANTISTNTAPINGGGGGLFLYQSAATLNNNTIISNAAAYNGGGIYLSSSNATLDGNTIAGNMVKTFSGGGLYVFSSRATVINSLITGNTANQGGGGVTVQTSSGAFRGNTVVSNTVNGRGGGVHLWANSTTEVCGNTVMSNTAADAAGGIYVDNSPATLDGNMVISNTTPGYGGGLYLNGNTPALNRNLISGNIAGAGGGLHLQASAANLNGNTITANRAGSGGGLYIYGSTSKLADNVIIANVAADVGGGICFNVTQDTLINNVVADNQTNGIGSGLFVQQSSPRLLHTTIARNIGGDGSGIHVKNVGIAYSTAVLTNTILVSQTVGITVTTPATNTAILNGVLWYSNTVNYDGGGTITVTNAVTGNPAFAADGYHLMGKSAAINQGVNTDVAADLDGDPRPMDGGYDLGADEFSTGCYARLNDGIIYSAIQPAVDASTQPADVVKVAGYCTGVLARAGVTQTLYVSKTITLRGGYTTTDWIMSYPISQPTVLDAQGKGRVVYIAGDISPIVDGLRITGGSAVGLGGGRWGLDAGGGVYIDTARVTLSNGRVFSNTADLGGGLYLVSSAATFNRNIVSDNRGYNGSGLFLYSSRATFNGNIVFGNMAQNYGGGMYLSESPAVLNGNTIISNSAYNAGGLHLHTSPATLKDNILSGNRAYSGGGGGLQLFYSNATLTNTVITDNQADTLGSGLDIFASSPRLLHTTLARNTGGDGNGVSVTDDGSGTYSAAIMTNTILVSHTIGLTVTTSNTITLNSVLWYHNAVNAGAAGDITVTNAITGDPAFAADGYHLMPGSAAIDAGVDAGVPDDIDGEPRPMGPGPDIGADERRVYVVYLPVVLRQ